MVGYMSYIRVNTNGDDNVDDNVHDSVDDVRRELVRRQSMRFENEDIPQTMPHVDMDTIHITYSDQSPTIPESPRFARSGGTMPLIVWHRGEGIMAAQIVLPPHVQWSRFQWACLNATVVCDGIDHEWTVQCGSHTWMAFVGDYSSDIVIESWYIVVCLGSLAYEATPRRS